MDEFLPLSERLRILAAALAVWLSAYFLVNRIPVDPGRRVERVTALDRRIPFRPAFAPVYFSTYLFVLQPFLIPAPARDFYWMLACFAAVTLVSTLVHALRPSRIERVEDPGGGPWGWMLKVLQRICRPYGNFPSMHVGLCVPAVAANFMAGGAAAGSIALAWAVLIALSTLFTKQHTLPDVLAGLAVGLVTTAALRLILPG